MLSIPRTRDPLPVRANYRSERAGARSAGVGV